MSPIKVFLVFLLWITTMEYIGCLNSHINISHISFEGETNITLTFTISNVLEHTNEGIKTLTVSVKNPSSPDTPICQVLHISENETSTGGCTYNTQSRAYSITRCIKQPDAELWRITASTRSGQDLQFKPVEVQSKKAPTIQSVTVLTNDGEKIASAVPQNSSVTVVCSWNSGYPPMNSLPRLFDHNKKDLNITVTPEDRTASRIKSVIKFVQCEDAGVIVCEAEEGGNRMNKTLLVRCAPSFDNAANSPITAHLGEHLRLCFPVRSHSTRLEQCELEKKIPGGKTVYDECESDQMSMSLSGSPPDLELDLEFRKVESRLHGAWTLKLTNEVGTGYLLLYINVTEDYTEDPALKKNQTAGTDVRTEPDTADLEDDGTSVTDTILTPEFGIIVGVTGGAIVLIGVVATAVRVLYKKRVRTIPPPGRHNFWSAGNAADVVMFQQNQIAFQANRDSAQSCANGHIYAEIPEDEQESSLPDSSDSFTSETESSGSNGYLHPTSSSPEATTATAGHSASEAEVLPQEQMLAEEIAVENPSTGSETPPPSVNDEPPYQNTLNLY